uniref:Uncharacterized protein n=1 Tax=Anopheles farauti TaxID=69004 RepID=A0A182Q8B5_9DIPT
MNGDVVCVKCRNVALPSSRQCIYTSHPSQCISDASLQTVPRGAQEQTPSRSSPHVGRSVVRTITIGNCMPEAIGHHRARVPDPANIHHVSNDITLGGDDNGDDDDGNLLEHDGTRYARTLPSLAADSFVTDSLNAKLTPASGSVPSFPSLPSTGVRCCETVVESRPHRLAQDAPPHVAESDLVAYHHHHHRLSAPSAPPPFQHQIREENAWQVFQTGDCKVIQSKIEYYETSIHRTPLTGAELFGADSTALCPHTAPLSTADSLDEIARTGTGSWHRQRTTSFGAGSDAPPKTADTTCSSCCFCNPELHNRHSGAKPLSNDGCFYCRAKLGQSPTRSFPAPPTPPNIQTSPVPPSPQTPITDLTPTPSLQEIALPVRKSSLAPRLTGKETGKSSEPTIPSAKPDVPPKKAPDPIPKTKPSKPPAESTSDKSSKRSNAKSSTATTGSSTVTGGEDVPQKPLPPVPNATPKMVRKKPTEPGSVLNRPKYTNHLTRASTVVQSVQKEIKNELRAPIRVLPKTAKEVNNRKEKERQIGLNLPGTECDFRAPPRPTQIAMAIEDDLGVAGGSAETHGYDNETSSTDGSDTSTSADSTPNASPFKQSNVTQQQPPQTKQAADPPTAATRWKTNSERNLSQLAIQKMVSASRWGSKWRKAATRLGEPGEQQVEDEEVASCSDLSPLKAGGAVGSTAGTTTTSNIISGISQTSSNQGWTVTVAGNYNPEMAPDVEMRLSFPKGGGGGGSSGKSALTAASSSAATSNFSNGTKALTSTAGHRNRQVHQYGDDPGEHMDGVMYPGASRSTSRTGTLPPAPSQVSSTLNPRRNLTRSDGTGATGSTSKDYRLPNVGPTSNILARPTARKAIKVPERSTPAVVVSSSAAVLAANPVTQGRKAHPPPIPHHRNRHLSAT